jgi:hypothetical protein
MESSCEKGGDLRFRNRRPDHVALDYPGEMHRGDLIAE